MTGTVYAKLGKIEQRGGKLHAIRTESLGSWEGPQTFCGETARVTMPRLRGQETTCPACRAQLGEVR